MLLSLAVFFNVVVAQDPISIGRKISTNVIEADTSDADALSLLQLQLRPITTMKPTELFKHVKCHAKVVVDVGLPRTGTYNFAAWAASLGYEVHHFLDGRNSTYDLLRDHHAMLFSDIPRRGLAFSDNPWAEDGCVIHQRQPPEMAGKVKYILMKRTNGTAWRTSIKHMTCTYWMFRSVGPMKHFCESVDSAMAWDHMTIVQNLGKRWCPYAMKHGIEKFCAKEHQSKKQIKVEEAMARDYMQHHINKIRACIPSESLFEVSLNNAPRKVQSMAHFLGCQGTIPPYPSSDEDIHALLENVAWTSAIPGESRLQLSLADSD